MNIPHSSFIQCQVAHGNHRCVAEALTSICNMSIQGNRSAGGYNLQIQQGFVDRMIRCEAAMWHGLAPTRRVAVGWLMRSVGLDIDIERDVSLQLKVGLRGGAELSL